MKLRYPKSQVLAVALIKGDPELFFHHEDGLSCLHYIARDGLLNILEVIASKIPIDDRFVRFLESEYVTGLDSCNPETALDIAIKNAAEGSKRWKIMEIFIRMGASKVNLSHCVLLRKKKVFRRLLKLCKENSIAISLEEPERSELVKLAANDIE